MADLHDPLHNALYSRSSRPFMKTATASLITILALFLGRGSVHASESLGTLGVSVIELGVNNFTRELSNPEISEEHCLIEFYAHWCPHCIHYKPVYESIGRYFNGDPRPSPHVWVLRLDCAVKRNIPICDDYDVHGYPTIYLGKTEDFLKKHKDKLFSIPPKGPPAVVQLIGSKLGTEDYAFEDKTTLIHIQPTLGRRQESAMRMDVDDVERATVELFEHLFGSAVVLASTRVREGFVDWVRLLAMAHPSQRCRGGCRYVARHIDVLWPEENDHPSTLLSGIKICTVHYNKKEWGSCAGSVPDTRGFTCGLWQLLHALSVNIDETAADGWMAGVRAFSEYFFGCAECAKHFSEQLKRDDAKQIETRTELLLWLWSIHNVVNKRLAQEELQQGHGDPAFPKVQWPPVNLCPACRERVTAQGVEWNNASVKEFLLRFYAAPSEPEFDSATGRKELIAGTKEMISTDVFSKEDATAIELKTAGSSRFTLYVFVLLVLIIVYVASKQRKRKLFPRRKDLL